MKIGLIDVDGHRFPNLAPVKLSAWHKSQGDTVDRVNFWDKYDRVYCSKVFTFTPDVMTRIQADEVVKGGTGYRKYNELFCDGVQPDYSLYPIYPEAYGFLTRGCIRHCEWCVVPHSEGGIRPYCDIETVLQGRNRAILPDNNVLASDFGLKQMEKIAGLKCRVDFNQGLDARLITEGTNSTKCNLFAQNSTTQSIEMGFRYACIPKPHFCSGNINMNYILFPFIFMNPHVFAVGLLHGGLTVGGRKYISNSQRKLTYLKRL